MNDQERRSSVQKNETKLRQIINDLFIKELHEMDFFSDTPVINVINFFLSLNQ
jgi:hypothetical protein